MYVRITGTSFQTAPDTFDLEEARVLKLRARSPQIQRRLRKKRLRKLRGIALLVPVKRALRP